MAVMAHEGSVEILYRDYPYPTGSGFTSGYLARPGRIGLYPVVVLLPGITGITPAIKDLSRRFARHGYATLVPDLTRGRHPGPDADFDELVDAYDVIDDRRAMADVDDAVAWAVNDEAEWARHGRYGLIGIDVGGRFAMTHAAHHQDDVGALVVAYAPLAGDEHRRLKVSDALEMLPMPVLGLYGAEDELVPADGVDEAQRRNSHGTWIRYEGVGHDFLDDGSESYHGGAAADAMARILALFEATLG